jgi:hypothetical protein
LPVERFQQPGLGLAGDDQVTEPARERGGSVGLLPFPVLAVLVLLRRAYDDLPGREIYRSASGIAVPDVLTGQFQTVLLVAGVLAPG